MKDSIRLLRKCAVQFRFYAQQHTAKLRNPKLTRQETIDTRRKADVNLALAIEVEDHLLAIEQAAAPPSDQYMPKPITE